ncbi:ribosome recycling factor [Roseisolibacter sp. H3M3-2]|uniref:ribosome recycling factor n=1 Tax=Roseisolibacter sp. H3M3-2 TaxID=3031323 RepID=UPI0023D9EFEE|nr:ribosome recycling factor [Roseisolibacter sp. H3M3-2]MDF1504695.1 ribosome recycling factor [Roseisolibacter sp. H3M3-2]
MATIKEILQQSRTAMEKGVENSKKEFGSIRAAKASPQMLDTVRVEAYGSHLPLNQVASVSAPEPRLLLVTPFDKGQAKVIEKAIRESDLGVEPSNMGGVIRVPLPSLNEQRRKELVKVVHKLAEEGRVAIRHARTDSRDKLKKLDGVSEDDKKHAEKDLQKLHDDHIGKIEALLKAKEAEIMEV